MTTAYTATGGLPKNLLPLSIAGAACVVIVVLFWEAFGDLLKRWGQGEELSHSYFIPLISLWLIWVNRDIVRKSVGAPSFAGAGIVAGGLVMLLLGQLTSIFVLQHIGLVVVIAGLVAAFGGLSLLRTTAPPVGFLFFAVPPPYWAVTVLSWKFKLWSSSLGVMMLEGIGVPAYLSGNVIDLGAMKLQVADACSGLNYLFPFLSLGVIAAFMYRGPFWHKLVIVLATIPITIVMNSFRIAATGVLVDRFGPEHAEGALHFFEGWVVFLICLVMLFAVIALLSQLKTPKQNALAALSEPQLRLTPPSRGGESTRIAAATLASAVGAILLSQVVKVDKLIQPDRTAFSALPAEQFADWQTQVRPIDASVAETLGADDAIVLNLLNPAGEGYNLYIAYLAAQRDGRSWHSPRQCIPGGGWKITKHTVEPVQTAGGAHFHVNRLVIENSNTRQLVYYWYDQRSRNIANEFIMKFWLIFDVVTKRRSDGAMVRLIAPVPKDATLEEVDAKLKKLLDKVDAFLPAYVPE